MATHAASNCASMRTLLATVVVLAAASLATAALAAAPPLTAAAAAAKIDVLPGLKTQPSFSQFAGYLPAGTGPANLFYWFVESQNDPANDPVVLWLNGGPGASSVAYGFWGEHGPFRLAQGGKEVVPYEHSWNKVANVIYLEAPAGVGFSYSTDPKHYATGDNQTATDNFEFLLNWFKAFPQFKKNKFYVTGESYGGHYCPTLANKILDSKATNGINMGGLFVGNPGINSDWFHNVDDYAFASFLYQHALMPQPAYQAVYHACGWDTFLDPSSCTKDFTHPLAACVAANAKAVAYAPAVMDPYDVLAPTCHSTSNSGLNATESAEAATDREIAAYVPWLDKLRKRHGMKTRFARSRRHHAGATATDPSSGYPYNPCQSDYAPLYMNRADVKKAIHADKLPPGQKWPMHLLKYGDEKADIAPLFTKFVAQAKDWKIMIFSGTADAAVPYIGTQRWIECLGLKTKVDWHYWLDQGGDTAGAIKDYEGMSLLTVKGCGHTVPSYCPRQGFAILPIFLNMSTAAEI